MPVNVLSKGQHTMMSPRRTLKAKKAHCMEAALLAAVAMAYHGKPALLMDLESAPNDYDHVICLFKERGRWGAISKTNYPVLRWRDPIYTTPRELAMSYVHEYFLDSGKKTLKRYSAPFDIATFNPEWVVAPDDVDWLADKLTDSPHHPIAPKAALRTLRKASMIEIEATALREWRKDGTKN